MTADVEAGEHVPSSASSRRSGSVFEFKNISYCVGKKYEKKILDDISGTVKAGDTLAIMGPSGAGKTTLINALTLSATGGKAFGSVKLNGVPMSSKLFEEECFVVPQKDNHWPYLTCRETLMYAAELYLGLGDHSDVVDDIITKMGLDVCKDTRVGNEFIQGLSGGQKRRLSIAVSLLKKPSLLFLDEPTSGLDAAAATNIMQELTDLAVKENLIIVITIHQPSGKVYDNFDQVMILSKGREAFTGKATEAGDYFDGIGHPMPENMNPAEFLLDLVNDDFTSTEEVVQILDKWEEHKKAHENKHDNQKARRPSFYSESRASFFTEVSVMFRRQSLLMIRDPALYIGRGIIFLFGNMFFGFVYWNTRERDQKQALNYMWLHIWFIGVACNMGVVAVYALNAEFKSVFKEIKNGMVRPASYLFAKGLLSLPIMFLFGICALGIPGYALVNFHPNNIAMMVTVWAVSYYPWETMAEAFSVLFNDPLIGMMQFMGMWFAAFLFAGFLIPEEDMVWPLKAFYYVMPYRYTVPSLLYTNIIDDNWDSCNPLENPLEPVCVDIDANPGVKSGAQVLSAIGNVFPLIGPENDTARNLGVLIAIAAFFKLIYIVGLVYLSGKATVIKEVKKE